MPDPESVGSVASWVQAGGVALFAGSVWFELKQQRAERRAQDAANGTILTSILEKLTALLERDRMKSGPIQTPRIPTEGGGS